MKRDFLDATLEREVMDSIYNFNEGQAPILETSRLNQKAFDAFIVKAPQKTSRRVEEYER